MIGMQWVSVRRDGFHNIPALAASTATSSRSPLLCSSLRCRIVIDTPVRLRGSAATPGQNLSCFGERPGDFEFVCSVPLKASMKPVVGKHVTDFKVHKRVGFASHGPSCPCCRPCSTRMPAKVHQTWKRRSAWRDRTLSSTSRVGCAATACQHLLQPMLASSVLSRPSWSSNC